MSVKSEALRYLGCGETSPDAATDALLEKALSELEKNAAPKYCFKITSAEEAKALLLGEDIKNHIAGCERVILFAATLGAPADTLIRRAEISDMAYALVLDAAASALTEEVCDNAEKEIKLSAELTGRGFTWRYSPGYGDYPITVQKELIRFLQADKLIGVTATESSLLLPRKSVTAVIGVYDKDKSPERAEGAAKRGCEGCPMNKSCKFKKEGKGCGKNGQDK